MESEDDGLLAELEAELTSASKAVSSPSPAPPAEPSPGDEPNERGDGVAGSSTVGTETAPAAGSQEGAQPEPAATAAAEPAPSAKDGRGSSEDAGLVEITTAEFARLQTELVALRTAKFDAEAQCKRAVAELEALRSNSQGKGGNVKAATKEFFSGVFRKGDKAAKPDLPPPTTETEPDAEKEAMAAKLASTTDQLKGLRNKVRGLNAEITLHKQTKDQLARDVEAARADLADQRATFKSSMAVVSKRNSDLESRLQATQRQLEESKASSPAATAEEGATSSNSAEERAEEPPPPALNDDANVPTDPPTDTDPGLTELKQEHEIALKRAARLETDLATEVKETAQLREQVALLRESLSQRQAGLERAEEGAASHKEEVAELRADLGAKSATVTDLEQQAEAAAKEKQSIHVKLLWTGNKLESTQEELTKCKRMLTESKEECEQIRTDSKNIMAAMQESHLSNTERASGLQLKVSTLTGQLASKEADIGEGKQALQDLQKKLLAAVSHSETLRAELTDLRRDARTLREEKEAAEKKLTFLLSAKDKLAEETTRRQVLEKEHAMLNDSTTRLSESLGATTDRLATAQAGKAEAEAKLQALAATKAELEEAGEQRLLKMSALEAEGAAGRETAAALEQQVAALTAEKEKLARDLEHERESLGSEVTYLTAQLNKEMQRAAGCEAKLEESREQNKILKKKNAKTNKDMAKQLQAAKRKVDSLQGQAESAQEPGSPPPSPPDTPASTKPAGLRQVQSSILYGSPAPKAQAQLFVDKTHSRNSSTASSSTLASDPAPASHGAGSGRAVPETRTLVDRLCRMRQDLEKREERVRFYESHCRDLTDDIQQKKRIIQHFLLREQTGALAPPELDANKAQRSKQGGAMASMFKKQPSGPGGLTLELSLEINSKLQLVLEDTLLKNIQLQTDLDTLSRQLSD